MIPCVCVYIVCVLEVGKMIDSKMHRDLAVYDSASMQQRDIIVIILFFLGGQ